MEEIQVPYWDVFPKSIKVSKSPFGTTVPLSVRGAPTGTVQFEPADPGIASVDEYGVVTLGVNPGATVIAVYDSEVKMSVRYVMVEVTSPASGGTIG